MQPLSFNAPHPTSTRKRAFTLIELLTVVVVVLILVGLLLPALGAARTRIKKQRALAEIRQMVIGIQGFHSDVTRWPVYLMESGEDFVVSHYKSLGYDAAYLANFFAERADLPMTQTALVRLQTGFDRAVRNYLTVDSTNFTAISIGPSNVTTSVLCDPWGQPYFWRFDYDANGRIPNPFEPGATSMVRASVLIWSAGPDRTSDTNGESSAANRDNLRSW